MLLTGWRAVQSGSSYERRRRSCPPPSPAVRSAPMIRHPPVHCCSFCARRRRRAILAARCAIICGAAQRSAAHREQQLYSVAELHDALPALQAAKENQVRHLRTDSDEKRQNELSVRWRAAPGSLVAGWVI